MGQPGRTPPSASTSTRRERETIQFVHQFILQEHLGGRKGEGQSRAEAAYRWEERRGKLSDCEDLQGKLQRCLERELVEGQSVNGGVEGRQARGN